MSLLVWLPLNDGTLRNLGMSPATFSLTSSSGISSTAAGKIGAYSYATTSTNVTSRITSDRNFYFPKDFSMACWLKVNTLANTNSANGVISHHAYTRGGGGISLKAVNSATCYLSFSSGVGDGSRVFHTHYGSTNIFGAWHHVALTFSRKENLYKLYVDGKLDKEATAVCADITGPFQIFAWATDYVSAAYIPAMQINDVRLWDECISPKEISEIAKGLFLHYPLRDTSVETVATNLIVTPKAGNNCTASYAWDKSLHPDAISVSGWSVGYNGGVSTGGVKNAEIGYHAHWQNIDGIATMVFPNINSRHSCKGRWEGISSSDIKSHFSATTTYTISFDMKAVGYNGETPKINTGIYYYNTSGTVSFHDGYLDAIYEGDWKHFTKTFTTKNLDPSKSILLYFYGANGGEGISYVRNPQITIENHDTGYVEGTRNSSGKIQDVSGYGNHLSVVGTDDIPVVNDSPRGTYSTGILKGVSTYLHNPSIGFPTDSVTMSAWFKANNVAGTGNYHIPINMGNGYYEFSIQGNNPGIFRQGFYIDGVRKCDTMASTTQNVTNGEWHMLTATYDGKAIKRYINGKLVNTLAVSGALTGGLQRLDLGHYGSNSQYGSVNSYMSDVRFYASALSEEDVLALYQDAAHIDANNKVYCHELYENAENAIKSTGVCDFNNFTSVDQNHKMKMKFLPDHSAWARILWHDVTTEPIWFTNAEAKNGCNEINRFSMMNLVESFKANKVTLTNLIPLPQEYDTGFNAESSAQNSYRKYTEGVGLQIQGATSAVEHVSASTKTAHYIPGHAYYVRMSIYQTTKAGGVDFYWKIAEPSFDFPNAAVTAAKQWTDVSALRKITTGTGATWTEGDYTYRIDFDDSTKSGVMMYYDGLMLIDLTEAFGDGNEPSKAWCDENIPYFHGKHTMNAPGVELDKYEFMLTYPRMTPDAYNRWSQTSSPNADTVTGYTPIHIDWTAHSAGIRMKAGNSVWNCDSGSTWYAALGQNSGWTSGQLSNQMPAANSSPTTEVELWVRIDNLANVDKTNIYEDLLSTEDFIEF